ncbi:MAG: hypothetical protein AAGJ18_08635 [Bacteroidota bacterium]
MHNIKFITLQNEEAIIPVPYDFDASGLVSTPYAKPNKNHKLESVKQRIFLGNFKDKKARQQSINLFLDKKAAIYRMVEALPHLDELYKIEMNDYLDAFYKTISSPELIKRAFPVNGLAPEKSDLEGEMYVKNIKKSAEN